MTLGLGLGLRLRLGLGLAGRGGHSSLMSSHEISSCGTRPLGRCLPICTRRRPVLFCARRFHELRKSK